MVSDQIVSLLSVPTKAGASFAAPVHRGVIEKQPLRGNEAFVEVHVSGNEVDTSERLFLINPTMVVGCEAS